MVKRVIGAGCVALLAAAASAQSPLPAGPEFRANAYTTGNQGTSRIAVQPNGDFIVVWTSAGQDGSGDGVFARRFFADGSPHGTEFRVNTYTTGHQRIPSVAVGASGAFAVVWASTHGGTYHNVHGQRYDAAGSPAGVEFQVNTYTPLDQSWPQVARAADGRFVVVWLTVGQDGSAWGLAGRRFDASGNPLGSDFLVNTYTTGFQWEHSVASDANGNFVVVWRDEAPGRDGSGWGVFGQRFDAAGNRLGGDFVVNTHTFQDQFAPNIAMNPGGSFVVAFGSRFYNSDQYVVRARRFNAAGIGIGSEFQVNTYTTGRQFLFDFGGAVALDGAGNFVVTWLNAPDWMTDPGDILGQRFDASGNKMGGEFAVNQGTVGWQDAATVGSDAAGNFVVTWFDRYGHDGSGWGAFARRFYAMGLQPAALTVDSGGNRVLEPNETVDVRPAWRNVSGADQTFGGVLSNFTGPAGATYTITDATGDYGTVADGATASCINCYAVSVSSPPARPASHWDAVVLEETTSPLATPKWWTVHVGGSFTDVSVASPFYPSIETLLHHGITAGCTFGKRNTFCPAAPVTREQMPPLLLLTREGAGYSPAPCTEPPMFADVPVWNSFCRWIEELARRGIVPGCGGGNYCPRDPVTREQMAIFVLRTLDPTMNPPACSPPNIYDDVPETSPFCRWIEELANRGAFDDCGGGNFCPTAPVTREKMSLFLSAPFGLTLYGP